MFLLTQHAIPIQRYMPYQFIKKVGLFDIPRRKFTWYKPNGTIKSRIDRFLVSREWLET